MLTTREQRDRLLTALEKCIPTMTYGEFDGDEEIGEEALALIAECRAADERCIKCGKPHSDIVHHPIVSVTGACKFELSDPPPENESRGEV